MFLHYLKTAYRILVKTKVFSVINILGLTAGMTVCLLILHFVHFEAGYDSFHPDSKRIYRLRYERESEDDSAVRFASCCPPAGALIRDRYPEVEKLARIFHYQAAVSYQNDSFYEDRIFFSDPEFFQIFDFRFLSGNPIRDLASPGNAFISESTARKYFAAADPIGKTITMDKQLDFLIVGIFADIPGNSHIKFDFLLPLKNLEAMFGDEYMLAWGHTGMFTYIKLRQNADPAGFAAKLPGLVEEHFGETLRGYNMKMTLPLQPLKDIHLTSHYMQEFEANGNGQTVRYLFVIAIFIIVMAWVNYINLSTARASYRAREVSLRKVVGASRPNLIGQFFMETFIINLTAMVFTLLLLALFQLPFHRLTGMPLSQSIWAEGWFWLWAGLLFGAGMVLSGFYPIFALTSFRITSVMKGKFGFSSRGINLRRILVTSQFVISLILLICTFTVYRQLSYMLSQDLGFSRDRTLVVKSPRVRQGVTAESFRNFRETLIKNRYIGKTCHVTEVPGRQIYWDAGAIKKMGESDASGKNYQIVGIDNHFIDLFELELVAGRAFSSEFLSDPKNLILNETAVSWMGFDNPDTAIGQKVDYWGEIFTIVGVLKDFHQQSLKEDFEPHIYRFMPTGRGNRGQFAIKLETTRISEAIADINKTFQNFFPGNPFDYFFLDDYYDQQYRADRLFGSVFRLFSIFTIFITTLGLFGLSFLNAARRKKEIGVRKVLGASAPKIAGHLIIDYLKWIAIATAIAWPLAYLAMDKWLQNFAFHTRFGIWIFIAPVLLTAAVTLLTVGLQTIRAAAANPVDALRYE